MSIIRTALPFFLLCCLSFGLKAQVSSYRQGVVLEGGGAAVGWAVSYEQVLKARTQVVWTARLGAGLTASGLFVPAVTQVHFLSGDYHPVAGLSVTARVNTTEPYTYFDTQLSDSYLHLGGVLGYRWQSDECRFFCQVHIVPGVRLDPTPTTISSTDPVAEFRAGAMIGFRLSGR